MGLTDGTKISGFVSAQENQPPRQCSHCIWYKNDKCHNPLVMVDDDVHGPKGKPKPVKDDDCCNGFQSEGKTLLFCVRHGEDDNEGLIGGWENSPLNKKGEQEAKEVAAFLKDKGIQKIICSDLKRTEETAKVIAEFLGIEEITTDFRARTWNKGYLNGGVKSEENKKVLEEYSSNPHWVIPEGESFFQFEERSDEMFESYVEEARTSGVILLVLHNSSIKQIQKYVNPKSTKYDTVVPGGILRITEKKEKLYEKIVKGAEQKRESDRN